MKNFAKCRKALKRKNGDPPIPKPPNSFELREADAEMPEEAFGFAVQNNGKWSEETYQEATRHLGDSMTTVCSSPDARSRFSPDANLKTAKAT